jgi:hypothetical protein
MNSLRLLEHITSHARTWFESHLRRCSLAMDCSINPVNHLINGMVVIYEEQDLVCC